MFMLIHKVTLLYGHAKESQTHVANIPDWLPTLCPYYYFLLRVFLSINWPSFAASSNSCALSRASCPLLRLPGPLLIVDAAHRSGDLLEWARHASMHQMAATGIYCNHLLESDTHTISSFALKRTCLGSGSSSAGPYFA